MKQKRLSAEDITGILKQTELGTLVQEQCQLHGVSEQSYYRWKKIYGCMRSSETRELNSRREDNVKRKRLVAMVQMDFSRRGKSIDNAVVELLNGTFREECLSTHWLESIDDAIEDSSAWRWDYNDHRRHRSLNRLTPPEYAVKMSA